MDVKAASPRDAAAVILVQEGTGKIFFAQRNPTISFLGGWYAFPGGKVDKEDADIEVRNCDDPDFAKFLATAVRETFEEVGVLLVRNGDKLTKGQRASLRDDLVSNRNTFAGILADWSLWIDAADFRYTGYWTTPAFSPVRFKTRFFIAQCPRRQEPQVYGEFTEGGFTTASDALGRWAKSEVLISPPVLIALQKLAEKGPDRVEEATADLLAKSKATDGDIDHIELNSRLLCFSLRTETLPPATHTNGFIVGKKDFIVVDAAGREETEQAVLHRIVDSYLEKGYRCREIIVSHLHRDHFGGEAALQKHISEKYGLEVPVSGHRLTAESLDGKVEFQKFVEDSDLYELTDEAGQPFSLTVLHTPGHARGHLAFYDEEMGFLLSSDNVVGLGSVLIAPPEGNMRDYLSSLERMRDLPGLRSLCGSHGSAVFDGKGKIEQYIAHRLEREQKIIDALDAGITDIDKIVERVYTDVSPSLYQLAALSVHAHLEKINADRH